MNLPTFRELARPASLALMVTLLAFSVTRAAGWVATAGELGREDSRFALHIGGNYGIMSGSEVEKLDPTTGYEAAVSIRALGNVSVIGSWAVNTAGIDGQVLRLLDRPMRPDNRSATVKGELETTRLRIGIRVDAYRERDWRFQPYLWGTVTFSTTDVNIVAADPNVDVSSFSDDQIGGTARLGVEVRITPSVAVDVGGTYEIVEPPPGTNASSTLYAGLVVRI